MSPITNINKQDGAPELRRRSQLLFVFVAIVFFGLISRLVFLQIVEGDAYNHALVDRAERRHHPALPAYARHARHDLRS